MRAGIIKNKKETAFSILAPVAKTWREKFE
jgi:hypothetical protein